MTSRTKNQDIRNHAKEKGVPLWELASHLGVSENTLYRRLRVELSQQEQAECISMIDSISERTIGAAANS